MSFAVVAVPALAPRLAPSPVATAAAQAGGAGCAATTGTGRSFANQDLTNRNFSAEPRGSLVGADFTGAKLRGAMFAEQDLSNARFQGADLGPGKANVNFTRTVLKNTCFAGANLERTDFSYAQITCADFSGTSLLLATFGPVQDIRAGQGCRTRFVGATLDVHLITDPTDPRGLRNWARSDFTRADFQNLSKLTFDLRGRDITDAILAGTRFSDIDMTGANLTGVDFSAADLRRATLDHAALNHASLFQAQAESASFACAQGYGKGGGTIRPDGSPCPPAPASSEPGAGVDFTLAGLKNTDFTGATMDHAGFAGANLNGTTFTNGSLVQANLQSTAIAGIGMSGPANVQFAIFNNVNFAGASLASVDFSGGQLVAASFDNTTLNGTAFAKATMPNASFKSANLQSVNFSAAVLQKAKFNGATVQAPGSGGGLGANFSCSQLGGADFKDARVAATNFANAVMPAEADCCPATAAGGAAWCGTVDATQQVYGPVTFPLLAAPVTCPNGDPAQCSAEQWKIPKWETALCNSSQAVQRMWSKPNCDGGSGGDVVTFADPNLEACILAGLPGQDKVLVATAQQIAQVNCPGRDIADVAGLEQFISLTKLDLANNRLAIFTLAFTSGGRTVAGNLQRLDVSANALTTLDLIAHPKLVSLNAAHNRLSSIALNGNADLVLLDASHNDLTSFNLPIQTSLAYVDLSYNRLETVLNQFRADLGDLAALSYLDLSHNGLTTIGSIGRIAYPTGSLQSLFLACNPKFKCQDLGIYDGKTYPAAGTSMCASYDASSRVWTPLAAPACPPG